MIASRTPQECFSIDGVQIKEADVGQPCTECIKCKKGYEPHAWSEGPIIAKYVKCQDDQEKM